MCMRHVVAQVFPARVSFVCPAFASPVSVRPFFFFWNPLCSFCWIVKHARRLVSSRNAASKFGAVACILWEGLVSSTKTLTTGYHSQLIGSLRCSALIPFVHTSSSVVVQRLLTRSVFPLSLQVTKVQMSEHVRQSLTHSRWGLSDPFSHRRSRTNFGRRSGGPQSSGSHRTTCSNCRSGNWGRTLLSNQRRTPSTVGLECTQRHFRRNCLHRILGRRLIGVAGNGSGVGRRRRGGASSGVLNAGGSEACGSHQESSTVRSQTSSCTLPICQRDPGRSQYGSGITDGCSRTCSFRPLPRLKAFGPLWHQRTSGVAENFCETWNRDGLRHSSRASVKAKDGRLFDGHTSQNLEHAKPFESRASPCSTDLISSLGRIAAELGEWKGRASTQTVFGVAGGQPRRTEKSTLE